MSSTTETHTPRRGDSPAKEQQILAGARSVFIDNGYQGASMASIAQKANVSKGTLYNYFTDKAELFSTFIKQECEEKRKCLLSPLHKETSPDKTLFSIAQTFLHLITDPYSVLLCRIILAEAQNFTHIGQVFWENGPQVVIETLTNWIIKQNKEGKLHADDPSFAAEQFLSLCQTGIVSRLRWNLPFKKSTYNEKKVIEKAVAVFLAAYGTPKK